MPKINPRAVPIITWLRKCFIRKTLERPTEIDTKIKIEVINRFLSIKKNKLVNKKKFKDYIFIEKLWTNISNSGWFR